MTKRLPKFPDLSPSPPLMRNLALLLITLLLAGCATGPDGQRLGIAGTLQKWEESMNNTEARLQAKNYSN